MFCPECGATDKQMVGDICIDCFLKNYQMIKTPQKIKIQICSHCNSKLKEGKWIESNIPEEEIIYRALENNIIINDEVEDEIIDLEIEQMKGSIAECLINVVGHVYGKTIEETHDVTVRILKTVCPTCSKIQSGYYEAVIQFRAANRLISEKEYEIANILIERTLNKQYNKDKLAYCPQIAKLKEGYDYYIGSLKSARKVANALKEKFGGIIHESPRLISEDKSTGKGLYRIWISVRIPEFLRNDFITYKDKLIQVTDIDKNRVQGTDLRTNKKSTILWKDYDDIKLIKKEEDIETTNIISKSPQFIQILDPINYSAVDLDYKEEFDKFNVGDEVKVIKIDNIFYLLN